MIKKILKYINKSEFTKNSLTLISGTTIAQLLPIAISPILTRIYSPEDFGVLALFMSLSMVFSIIAGGRYELAIILPKKDSYAINILALVIVLSAVFSLILMLSILFFHNYFVTLLENPEISVWLYILPLIVFLLVVFNALNYYHTRLKQYKLLAATKVIRSGVMSFLQLGLFVLKSGVVALISGYSFAQFAGNITLFRKILKDKKLLNTINKPRMIALAKRYKSFPKKTMIAGLFNKGSSELPNILITPFFNVATLGFYSLGYRMLSIPSAFIGMSVSQVFMQTSNDEVLKTGKSIKIFKSVLKKLLLIGIPFFGILALTAEPIFGFVFGNEWKISGTYAMILTPLLFTRFIASSLSVVLFVFEKHTLILISQITLLVLSIGVFVLSNLLSLDFRDFLIIFTIVLSIYYLVYLILLWLVSDSKI